MAALVWKQRSSGARAATEGRPYNEAMSATATQRVVPQKAAESQVVLPPARSLVQRTRDTQTRITSTAAPNERIDQQSIATPWRVVREIVPTVENDAAKQNLTVTQNASSDAVIQFVQPDANIAPPTLTLGRNPEQVLNDHTIKNFSSTTLSSGTPLPVAVKNPLTHSFSIDLTPIRVHTDASAQQTVRRLQTRAFAYGHHIFLGPGESPSDLRLMAHEVAHVVQQTHGAVLQHFTTKHGDALEQEAEQASAAVMRGHRFTVRQRTKPRPQGLFDISLPDPLTWLAGRVNSIPGFRMLTIIIGMNPVNGAPVERSAANILRAMIEFIPGGELITQALDNYGIFDRVGTFVEQQIESLGMAGSVIADAVSEFIDSLSPADILNLGGVWDRAVRIFTTPIDRIISFGANLVTGILEIIKDVILRPLAGLASETRGWDLLIAVLGENPITGDPVDRSAENLIGGFMKLIGQEEVWTNLQRANAVARAWAWFQGALSGVMSFVTQIPTLFMSALNSLELIDVVLLPRAFGKVASVFGSFAGQFISWAGEQVMSLLEIIFEVLAPSAMPYIRRAAGALETIFRDPIGFVGNLVRAGIQGFRQFGSNFLTHLRASLIGWLTGSMSGAGVYIPQGFNVREIIKFVLSVLGLTWQNIRTKLVRAIGEPAVRVLETTFRLVMTLVTEGPAAAWQQIQEGITNLREMVMEQIMSFVRDRIVQAAITRLVTSLNPAGAFIQAVIAIYNTIMFFIERLRQITQVAMSFIDSIAAIASGNIGAAANRVEQTMAGLLTLVISFLARLVGLGRVSDAVVRVVNRIRAPIDRALDRVVAWIVQRARNLAMRAAGGDPTQTPQQRLERARREIEPQLPRFMGRGSSRVRLVAQLAVWRVRYGLTALTIVQTGRNFRLRAVVNPPLEFGNGVLYTEADMAASVRRIVLAGVGSHPTVQQWRGRPTQQVTALTEPIHYPAAALQAREQLQTHPVIGGPPFAVAARAPSSFIELGGGRVEEGRARATSVTGAPLEQVRGFAGPGHYTPDVLNAIRGTGLSDAAFALNMQMLIQTGAFEPGLNEAQRAAVRRVTWLIHGTESARNVANIAHAPMVVTMVGRERMDFSQALSAPGGASGGGILPATMPNLPATARALEGQIAAQGTVPGLQPRIGGQRPQDVPALVTRESEVVIAWVNDQLRDGLVARNQAEVDAAIQALVQQYYSRR